MIALEQSLESQICTDSVDLFQIVLFRPPWESHTGEGDSPDNKLTSNFPRLAVFFSQFAVNAPFTTFSRLCTYPATLLLDMKTLRKSLNGHKDHSYISSPVSSLPPISKPIAAVQPPKKVIRALNSYRATVPQELSFEKGDFFHVVNDVSQGQWYEAHNPMSGARGLVPSNMFEVFSKGGTT